jgi:hypothetical protein
MKDSPYFYLFYVFLVFIMGLAAWGELKNPKGKSP